MTNGNSAVANDGTGDSEPAETSNVGYDLPAIPAAAGAMIFDDRGRLLILKPTYKSGWTVPGGVMESDGETPWQACQREVREETGLEVGSARLACVDWHPAGHRSPAGIRFMFDCGVLSDEVLARITLQAEEIAEHKLAPVPEALRLLRGPLRRRVKAGLEHKEAVYLEDGQAVRAVSNDRT